MSINPIYEKWTKGPLVNNNFEKWLINFGRKKTEREINEAFSKTIKFVNNKIISQIGVGTNLLNDYTVAALSGVYSKFLKDALKDKEQPIKVFLATDNSNSSNLFLNIFARVLTENSFKSVIFNNSSFIPLCYKSLGAENSNCDAIVTFQEYYGDSRKMQISFNWGDGSMFNLREMNELSMALNSTDFLTIDIPEKEISFQYDNSYVEYLENIYNRFKDSKYINKDGLFLGIDISRIDSKRFYLDNISKLDLFHFYVKRTKNANVFDSNDQNSLQKIYWESLSRKSKINFVINQDGAGVNFSVKHKRKYKYFKPDEIAALYLNFLLTKDENFNKDDLQKGYIAFNQSAGTLTKTIALKHNLPTKEFISRSNLWSVVKENEDKKLLFAYNQYNEFVPYNRYFNGYDANLFMLEIIRMANYYKTVERKDLFQVLEEIYSEYGRHQLTTKEFAIDSDEANRFFKRIQAVEKIKKKYEVTRNQKLKSISSAIFTRYKLSFRNGESVILEYSQLKKQLKIYCETIEQKSEENSELAMVVRNREILDGIFDLKEESETTKFTWVQFLKYFFYVAFLAAIIIFLFYSVYNLKGGIGGSPKEVFQAFGKKLYVSNDIPEYQRSKIIGYKVRASFMFIVLSFLLYSVIQTIIFKRIIAMQGAKAKSADIYIGTAIGVIIQTITPKSIGGDIAVYWYLRRKGVERSILFSAIIVNTFLWQATNVLITVTTVPFGVYIFSDLFKTRNAGSIFFMTMLILGIVFDTVLSVVLLVVTMNMKAQKWLIKVTMGFVEWFPFIKSYDAFSIKAKYEYELYNTRYYLKNTFKNIWVFFELFFYKLIPVFITATAVFAKSIDIVKPDVKAGYYMNMTIQDVMIRVANAVSLTPGGTGTGDFLYKVLINESLQVTAYDGIVKGDIYHSEIEAIRSNAAIMTAMSTLGTVIIPSVISAILLVIVYIGEKRIDYYRKKNKNRNLIQNKHLNTGNISVEKTQTKYFKIAFPMFWILLAAGTLMFIFIG